MKNLLFLLLTSFLLTSCCTTKNCNTEEIYSISLVNFQAPGIDTIYVKSYQRNTSFNLVIDSIMVHPYPDGTGRHYINTPFEISDDKDYRVDFPGLGKTYDITGINFEKIVCSDCLPGFHSYYEELKSYEVNEGMQMATYFYILR